MHRLFFDINSIFTARIRRMGKVIFSVCSHLRGTLSKVGGTPARSRGGTLSEVGGYSSQV